MREEWKGLNLVDLMEILEPVPEPEPVSMMPQTVGWLGLGVLVLALIIVSTRYFWRIWQNNAYRRQALTELKQGPDDPWALSLLLKRTALAAFPRKDVASLYGNDWLEFLDQSYGGTEFRDGPGRSLASALYQDNVESDHLKPLVRTWIRKHRGELP